MEMSRIGIKKVSITNAGTGWIIENWNDKIYKGCDVGVVEIIV